jgi:hypothetical protein
MTHPLTRAVARALPRPRPPLATRYLALLDRRLARADRLASGLGAPGRPETKASRTLARRFLRPHEGAWSDGDENLVREYLDVWHRQGVSPVMEAARTLSKCARTLATIEAPPSTLWFFLWEMESMLESGAFVNRPNVPGGR